MLHVSDNLDAKHIAMWAKAPLGHVTVEVRVTRQQSQWELTYPVGIKVRTIRDVVDPTCSDILDKGSILTVLEVTSGNVGAWIKCRKEKGSFITDWSVRPRDVEIIEGSKQKGRYRILLQNKENS